MPDGKFDQLRPMTYEERVAFVENVRKIYEGILNGPNQTSGLNAVCDMALHLIRVQHIPGSDHSLVLRHSLTIMRLRQAMKDAADNGSAPEMRSVLQDALKRDA